jgi:hypothetical protein
VPIADVAGGDIFKDVAHFRNNLGVRDTIAEHGIYLVTVGFAQAGDFASGTAFFIFR